MNNGWFYYLASPENATQKYLYRIKLDGTGKAERVTPADQPGSYAYAFSPDAGWAFHTYSTFDTPPRIELVKLPEHKVVRTREDNPEGYAKSARIHFAEGLKGDLLIVHGTGEIDTRLHITDGLVDCLIELGKRFDYMSYPHRDHGLSEGSGTPLHLRVLMTRYLLEHLPPGPR